MHFEVLESKDKDNQPVVLADESSKDSEKWKVIYKLESLNKPKQDVDEQSSESADFAEADKQLRKELNDIKYKLSKAEEKHVEDVMKKLEAAEKKHADDVKQQLEKAQLKHAHELRENTKKHTQAFNELKKTSDAQATLAREYCTKVLKGFNPQV